MKDLSSKYIGLVVFFSLPEPENIFFLSVSDEIVFMLPRLFFTFWKFLDQYNTSLVSVIVISDLSNDNVSNISASYDRTGNDSDPSSIVIVSLLLHDETIREIKKIRKILLI